MWACRKVSNLLQNAGKMIVNKPFIRIEILYIITFLKQLKANEKRSFHIVIIDGWNDPRFKLINEVKKSIISDELEIMKAFGKELDNSSTHMLVTGIYYADWCYEFISS